jgi:hypothetical protein
VPGVSLHDYLCRIDANFHCSEECLILGLVYIDRIATLHPEFEISTLNIHRLLLTSVVVAAKFHDDFFYSNTYYAKVGGVRLREMNTLESEFVRLIDWRLYVVSDEFSNYREQVLKVASSQGEAA